MKSLPIPGRKATVRTQDGNHTEVTIVSSWGFRTPDNKPSYRVKVQARYGEPLILTANKLGSFQNASATAWLDY
jgi:hypothetical protein